MNSSNRLSLRSLSKVLTLALLFSVGLAVAEPSAYIEQIIPLLPTDGRLQAVLPGTPESERIDDILLQVLSSPHGKTFCQATPKNFDFFKRGYFINESAARKGFELCQGLFATSVKQLIFEKKYYVISTKQTNLLADAWTTPRNETYLILSEPILTSVQLPLILIHELTVSLDRKEQIGFMGIIDFPKLGLNETQSSCDLVSVLRNTQVKHLLSALRAFDVEHVLAKELKLPTPEGFDDYGRLSCEEKIKFIGPSTSFLAQNTAAENMINKLMDQPYCNAHHAELKSFDEVAQYLQNLNLSFSDGSTQTACDYLTEGFPFYAGVSFRGGPRPRLGGGWKISPKMDTAKGSPVDREEIAPKSKEIELIKKGDKLPKNGTLKLKISK